MLYITSRKSVSYQSFNLLCLSASNSGDLLIEPRGYSMGCMYAWSSYIARVRISQLRLPILFVISSPGKMNTSLSPSAPENLVSRDRFGSPAYRQPAHLHTQSESAIVHDTRHLSTTRRSSAFGANVRHCYHVFLQLFWSALQFYTAVVQREI